MTIAIPSITGKTIGTDPNTSSLAVVFWLDAGSTFNARTNSLGQQSGTFDIAQVQLEAGSVATNFEYQSFGDTLQRCLRYYEKSFPYTTAPVQNAGAVGATTWNLALAGAVAGIAPMSLPFKVTKRAIPTMTFFNTGATNAQVRNLSRSTDATAYGGPCCLGG